MESQAPDIKYLFEPRGVMVVGASSNPSKIGYKLAHNIHKGGYTGELRLVNPGGGTLLGQPVHRTITEVPGTVDMALISIPAPLVFQAVKDCSVKGVKFLIIITSGFGEVGNLQEEREMVAFAHQNGMRILGPNVIGLYSAPNCLDANFGPGDIQPGNVAILTQSGAIGIAVMGKTKTEHIGLSAVVSVGNKSDLDEADLLEYLIQQEQTEIILMYIEGLRDGRKLIEALKKATRAKPVIIIKSGRSKRGAQAAASHTGSLAGQDQVFDDLVRQAGALRAESIGEALSWTKFLSHAPAPKGENCVIITNGGGVGVLATDACEKYDISLFNDQNTLEQTFLDSIPSFGSLKNPVDITGQAPVEVYEGALEAALQEDDIHSVMCLGCQTAVLDVDRFTSILKAYHLSSKAKPTVVSFVGGAAMDDLKDNLGQLGITMFEDVYQGVSSLGALYASQRHMARPQEPNIGVELDLELVRKIVSKVREDNRSFLLADEARQLMEVLGIKMPKSRVARTMEEAVEFAEEVGYPVVLKVVSKDILHKSDAGGVVLDLEDQEEVIEAYQAIRVNARNYDPTAHIEGVEVAEMLIEGTETIVGGRRDPTFGPTVMFGLGGIYVEVMKDVAFRSFPLPKSELMKMISDIRSYPIILGVRGEQQKDIDGIADTIIKVGSLIEMCEDITDIEINPLLALERGQGVKAVDARILLSTPQEG